MNRVTRSDPRDAWIAAALGSRAEHSHPRNDCPLPERIWDAVRLQVSLDDRLEIIDHLAECPTCSEAWSLAAELEIAHEQLDQPNVTAPAPASVVLAAWPAYIPASARSLSASYGRNALLIGTAAVLFVALGIGLLLRRPDAQLPRDAQPPRELTELLQRLDQQVADLSQSDFRLRWTPGPAGARYDVTVLTPDMDVVAEVRNLDVAEYQVPPERLAAVTEGTTLLWRIIAHTPEGSPVSSGQFAVRLRQERPSPRALTDPARSDVSSLPPEAPDTRAPQAAKIYDSNDADVTAPAAVRQDMPPFTTPVLTERKVVLFIVIDETGAVESAIISKSSDSAYDRMLLAAAKLWAYRPAMRNGVAVKYRKGIQVTVTPPTN